MHIISRGTSRMNKVQVYCQFRCEHCGILFETEDDMIWETKGYFQCDCPECGNIVRSFKNNLKQGRLIH